MLRIDLHPPRWRLIVNADDFGVDAARDAGILELARGGHVTSASALVNGAHFAAALAGARRCGLPVGLHLNLSEGPALAGVSSLTDAQGRLLGKWALRRALDAGRVAAGDLAREIRAQMDAFIAAAGQAPDHVDGHQHCHVHPRVAPVLAPILAREYGLRRIRLPCECAADDPPDDAPEAGFHDEVCAQAAAAAPLFAAHDLRAPDAFIGLTLMGRRLSAEAVAARLSALLAGTGDGRDGPPRVVELMCHPGHRGQHGDAFNRSPGRAHEQAVLASPAFAAARAALAPASFADLPPRPGNRPRVLIVSKLHAACGNHTTALDLARILAPDATVLFRPLPSAVPHDAAATAREAAALADDVAREGIDLVLGIHAWRCGALFLAAFRNCAVPWLLVFSGTDANGDLADPARRPTLGAALAACAGSLSLSADMADRVHAAFPALPRPRLLQPPPRVTPHSGASLRRRLHLRPAQRLVLMPAGIRPVKGVRFAIDAGARALRQHPQDVLVIVGPVLDADYAQGCDAAIAAHADVAPRLMRLPALDRTDYLAALAEADLLLNTSQAEGLPNALLEAMAAGVPILAHDIAGNRALLAGGTAGVGGLLYRGEADFLAGWRRLLADAALRRTLAVAARQMLRRTRRRVGAGPALRRLVRTTLATHRVVLPGLAAVPLRLATGTHPPDADNLALFRQAVPRHAGATTALDLGCGSGLFALALIDTLHAAGRPLRQLTCCDRDAATLDALGRTLREARGWLAERGLDSAQLAAGDLFSALPADARFDVVVANLPQTPTPHALAADRDGHHDGADLLCAAIAALPGRLTVAGEAFLLHIGLAHPARVAAAVAAAGLDADVVAAQTRTVPLARYAALAADLPAHLRERIAAGTCDARLVTGADGHPALRFPVRLLRLVRR